MTCIAFCSIIKKKLWGAICKQKNVSEPEEVLEDKNSIQNLTLTYKKNILKPHKFSSRIQIEKIKFIEKFFNNIDINKDKYLLKYIYYDIFKQEIKSILKIHSELKDLIYTDLDKIYHSIKKITIELKQ